MAMGMSGASASEIPTFLREQLDIRADPASLRSTSSFEDHEYRRSWYLGEINASEAYAMGYTGKGVTIAVVDTGIDVTHPEFTGRISPRSRFFAVGRDPFDLSDVVGHGTHVSGIIGAARNGRGTMGVAYDATIMTAGTNFSVAKKGEYSSDLGLIYAARNGASVINGSYGPPPLPRKYIMQPDGTRLPNRNYVEFPSKLVVLPSLKSGYEAVKTAARNDVVMVFAAGNDYHHQPQGAAQPSGIALFPAIRPENHRQGIYSFLLDAKDPNDPRTYKIADMNDPDLDEVDMSDLYGTIIAVVATNRQGRIASYSNRCGITAFWCLAAPGGDVPIKGQTREEALIQSTLPYSKYDGMSGTSMAAPVVSGGAAVLRGAFPYMTARQIIEVMLTTATPMGAPEIYGRGMFNLGRAAKGPYEFGADGFAQRFDVDTKGWNSAWSNDIRGTGGLIKRGEGNLLLMGENTYAGGTDVLGGILTLNGSVKSRLAVHVGATLRGLGRIEAPLSVAGTLEPGSVNQGSIGTLTVNGDARLLKSSTYRVDTNARGQHDRLAVSGQTTLASGTLEIALANGIAPVNKRMIILSSNAGTKGTFGRFRTNSVSGYLDPDLDYAPKDLSVTFRRNGVTFSSVARSTNQASVAVAAEGLGNGNPVNDALIQNSLASTPGALDSLSGDAHGSQVTATYGDAALVSGALLDRLRQPQAALSAGTVTVAQASDGPIQQVDVIHSPTLDSRVFSLWGSRFDSWGRMRSDGNAGAASTSRGGFILGADATIDQNVRIGIAGGVTATDIEVASRLSSGTNKSIFGALYGSARWGAINARLGASYAAHDINMSRRITFVGFQDQATSSYDGTTMQAFGEIGYRVGLGAAELEPFIGASVLRVHTGAFAENGGIGTLTGFSRDHDLATTTLGLRAEATLSKSFPLTLRGMLGWRHAYGDVDPTVLRRLHGGATTFAVSGIPMDRNALVAEAGLDWQVAKDITLGVAYQGRIGTHAQEHALNGNLTWRFGVGTRTVPKHTLALSTKHSYL
ncbi:autotransporter domain-containing protein [Microvirga tunisiensis]|nr:autotransporter serine protease [Microvirga tunisiensis]